MLVVVSYENNKFNVTILAHIYYVYQFYQQKVNIKKVLKILTLTAPRISESCIEIKINLHFYFYAFLWCFKRFYEGLQALK